MNLEKLTTNCLCMSVFVFLFVFLLFKRTREGVTNPQGESDDEKAVEQAGGEEVSGGGEEAEGLAEVGSDELSIGKNWKIKPVNPNEQQMKKLQQSGEKMKPENFPKNLAFMFSPKEGDEWKEVYIMYPDGIMKGKEFKTLAGGK